MISDQKAGRHRPLGPYRSSKVLVLKLGGSVIGVETSILAGCDQ